MNVGEPAHTSSFILENTVSFKACLLFKDVHADSEVW